MNSVFRGYLHCRRTKNSARMLSRVLLSGKAPTAPPSIGRVFSNLVYTQRMNIPNGVYFAMLGSVAAGLYLGNRFAIKVLCRTNPANVCYTLSYL